MPANKKIKREKRRIKNLTKEIIKTAIQDLQRYPFLERVKFAWFIIKGRK